MRERFWTGGDCRRQGSQSEGPGLTQLISSRTRPQTAQQQQPSQQSSCEMAGGENVSLTLQIVVQRAYLWLSGLTLSDLTPVHTTPMFHLVQCGSVFVCACSCEGQHVCWKPGYNVKCSVWMSTRSVWGNISCKKGGWNGGARKGATYQISYRQLLWNLKTFMCAVIYGLKWRRELFNLCWTCSDMCFY